MTDLCRGMVEERRAHPVARRDFNADPETGETLNDEVVRNLITFLVAGTRPPACCRSRRTTSSSTRDPRQGPAGGGRGRQRAGHRVAHPEAPYLDAVFREALRLAPTAVAFYVTPYKPELLAGKYLVEPGEAVCCPWTRSTATRPCTAPTRTGGSPSA